MESKIQITIIGTGCVGTSIGLALHAAESPVLVVAHDKNPENAGLARKQKAVDKVDWNLIGACEEADLVILAIPLPAIEETLRVIAPYLKAGCVVTDTADLKAPVSQWAADLLPDSVSYIGGNPLLTGTTSGPAGARADLFRDLPLLSDAVAQCQPRCSRIGVESGDVTRGGSIFSGSPGA